MKNPVSSPNSPSSTGKPLRVLIVARVSDPGPGKQDERSVKDQEELIRSWIEQNLPEPVEIEVFANFGRGEWLDREEFHELCEKVTSGNYDLVVTEDLGRIIRRIQAHIFAEECVDHGVRLIALNDHVDTSEVGWQDRSIFSAWHHERSNRDTSDRIKRTLRARFQTGGCASIPIYGLIKPPGAKSDLDWRKDPAAEPIFKEWFERLDRGETFSDIADWLNEQGIPTGPYCRSEQWDCSKVGRVTRNPILKGMRRRNNRESWRDSRGKYRTRKADPSMLLEREVPHLAFFTAEYYDDVIQKVNEKNARYSRVSNGEADPRRRVPRKQTRFPGQIIHCGICGRLYVFGGHGQKDHLMCDGARQYCCWNGVSVDGPLAAQRIGAAVLETIEALPEFDEAFLADVNAEADRLDADRIRQIEGIDVRLGEIDRQLDNLVAFIANGRGSDRVSVEINSLETEQAEIQAKRQRLVDTPRQRIEIPPIEDLKGLARNSLQGLADDSWEFCKVMHRLIPKVVVFPYRLCDGGKPILRATLRLQFSNVLEDSRASDILNHPLERVLNLNLFNEPQRALYREQIVRMRKAGKKEVEAARECGITVTAAQRAGALQRKMNELGLMDPYLRLTVPPDDYPKLRRHRHSRYRFHPLPDAGEW